MGHPANRAERRRQRSRAIAKRRFQVEFVPNNPWRVQHRTNPLLGAYHEPAWGKFAKWNLSCGSLMCHADKHFGARRKRRLALARAGNDELLDLSLFPPPQPR